MIGDPQTPPQEPTPEEKKEEAPPAEGSAA